MSELPVSRPSRPVGAGRTVGPYTLLTKVGEGGMGVVHLARHEDGSRVALKVLRPHIVGDDQARARLAREVGSLERIRSRWVAEIIDADPWAEVPYVATRYVPGLSLHDHVVEEGPITGRDLLWFAACLAEGLASVHEVGVLHRDVKPSNVLMEGRTPILIDFGLARVADDPRLTHTGWLLGTPGYLAPEILYGEDATAASDIHSWAATVAYAGTGGPPFGRGPAMAIMDRVRRGEHDLEGLPGRLREVVDLALDPEPAERPTLAELLGWLRPQTTRVDRPVPPPPQAEDVHTQPFAAAALAAAVEPTDHWTGAPVDARDVVADETPTRYQPEYETQYDPEPATSALPWQLAPEPLPAGPAAPGMAERAARAVLWAGGALAVGAGLAAYPWVVAVLVVLAVWLLRSGSLAASAAGDRRLRRGRRWYDGAQFLLGAPWHLVRSVPTTALLVLWSAGLATAGALVCYAVATTLPVALGCCGVVLAVALWCGPGSSRVRSPLSRVVNPLARDGRRWLVALVVLVALVGALGWQVDQHGTDWRPDDARPFQSVR
ncbi:serine/threonine-protein kinase [Nocardioides pantholopis]|uniref:serine/threonine-protein kinase n=1 Tax=Nocardioides pantholopis TaxID=2483798 RepID=UPI000F07B4DA|nr:serine/threonine-protein kinase [Nocardioides pantholopis]